MKEDPEHYMGLPYAVKVKHDPGAEWPWFARVVELPGCMTWAETFEELGPMIEDAKRGWIEDALEHGDPLPKPSSGGVGSEHRWARSGTVVGEEGYFERA